MDSMRERGPPICQFLATSPCAALTLGHVLGKQAGLQHMDRGSCFGSSVSLVVQGGCDGSWAGALAASARTWGVGWG